MVTTTPWRPNNFSTTVAYLVELTAPRQVGLREYTEPVTEPDQVRVRTLFSGISAGTELTQYRGTNPYLDKQWDPDRAVFLPGPPTLSYPVDAWGYSEVGVVDQVGTAVESLTVGDVLWGIWGHRSHAVLRAATLARHVLSVSLHPMVGTFDRVGAVALDAVLTAQANPGETVAIFGQGVIGLLATQLLVSMGCRVLAMDPIPSRLALASRWGAMPFDPSEGDLAVRVRDRVPDGVDRLIELSGSYAALNQAIRIAGPGGIVVAAGFYQGPISTLTLGEEFHHNRVTLISCQIGGVPAHLRGRWTSERLHETVMELCAEGRLDPLPLVSHVIDAHDAASAYALLDSPPDDLLQVILDFRGGQP
jgi:2-desacetyl-2-hydroxyethyl bacteriochlorophyllide A dehydrogenase